MCIVRKGIGGETDRLLVWMGKYPHNNTLNTPIHVNDADWLCATRCASFSVFRWFIHPDFGSQDQRVHNGDSAPVSRAYTLDLVSSLSTAPRVPF